MIVICEFLLEQWLQHVQDVCLSAFVLSNLKNPATKSIVQDVLCISFNMIQCWRNINALTKVTHLSFYPDKCLWCEQQDCWVFPTAWGSSSRWIDSAIFVSFRITNAELLSRNALNWPGFVFRWPLMTSWATGARPLQTRLICEQPY